MKNLITLIALTLLNTNCFAQDCDMCNPNHDHSFSAARALPLIKKLNSTSPYNAMLTYGGTIYEDATGKNYFRQGGYVINPPAGFTRIFKFHFCSNTDTPDADDFYLVFENSLCFENKITDSLNAVATYFFYKSGDITFPKIPLLPPSPASDLQGDGGNRLYPTTSARKTQWITRQGATTSVDLSRAKLNFARKTLFTNELIGCRDYVGYFVYDTSIEQILSDPNCKGIRYYLGFDPNVAYTQHRIRVILVGVDRYGNNLNTWRETSVPIPSFMIK